MSTHAIKCTRCGSAIPDLTMEELSSVESIFKRPLILCDACIAAPVEQPYTQKQPTNAARPLPAWTPDWTERAVADLKHFTGEPLAKARQLLPYIEGNGTIAIIGDRGRGKTVMATWLAANLDREAFSQTAGPSLVSRISQTGGIVQCHWSNFRAYHTHN